MSALPATSDDRDIWDCWLSQYRLPVVTVADEVGTFDAIASQGMSTDALAEKLVVDARALAIHLALLAATDFVERRDGLWRATATSRRWLLPDAEGYYGPALHGFRQTNPLHAQLLSTLRTGVRAEGHATSVEEWERGDMPAEFATMVTAYMNAHSRAAAKAVAHQSLFQDVCSMLDVGGGSAIFPIEIARALPTFHATVMEIGVVCDAAQVYIDRAGVAGQVATRTLNMFTESWPTGHDTHFLSNIFHDWSDKTCGMLADKSFEALPSGGRIVLHEMLLDDDGCGPWQVAAFSLLMLLGTKGRQFSFVDLKALLEDAGFADVAACRTGGGYYSLVTARKP